MRSFRDLVCVVGLLATHSCIPHIRPDRPQYSHSTASKSAPTTPPALVTSSLPISLASVFTYIENNTPSEILSPEWDGNFSGSTGWTLDESDRGLRYRYHLWRLPMRMSLSGDQIVTELEYQYNFQAQKQVVLWVGGHCGEPNESRRRLGVRLKTALSISPNWHLVAHTTMESISAIDPCDVAFMGVVNVAPGVTNRVRDSVSADLTDLMATVDTALGQIDVKTPASRLWNALQRPIRMSPESFLMINPSQIYSAGLDGSQNSLSAGINMFVNPAIVFGSRPTTSEVTIPNQSAITDDEPPNDFSILVESPIDYRSASAAMSSAMRMHRLTDRTHSKHAEIGAIRVAYLGGNSIVVAVAFGGSAEGVMYFVGTPHFDEETGSVSIPDLDYDSHTSMALAQDASWLRSDEIRQIFRGAAHWTIAPLLNQVRTQLNRALNRSIAPGITTNGAISGIEGIGVQATANGLVARIRAEGLLSAEIYSPDSAQ